MFIHKEIKWVQFKEILHWFFFPAYFKVKTIVHEQVSQAQTQLKSGFASKVSAYSKNFLMAVLGELSPLRHSQTPSSRPASSLFPSGDVQSSRRTFICPFLAQSPSM